MRIMAGPDGRAPGENNGKPTGTKPKSRSNTSSSYRGSFSSTGGGVGGGHQALVNLMREYQAVNESLAAAREQIEREAGQGLLRERDRERERWGEGQRRARAERGAATRNSANDEKLRELEMLRSRMLELEGELSTSRDTVNNDDNSISGQSFNISAECDSSEEMERNLALLTAQYEKTSQDEDFSPAHIMVNNSLDIDKVRKEKSVLCIEENLTDFFLFSV